MQALKQSTQIALRIGPFLDQTNGYEAETGLTITQPDVRLSKAGGDFAQKSAAETLTHDEGGWYIVTLSTTDTNTLGMLDLYVHKSGALPVWRHFMVMPANVWDSMYGADYLHVNVAEISEDATAANNLESYCDGSANMPVDATKISGSSTAADNVEANIGNLDAAVSSVGGVSAADIADAVWDEAATGHTDAGKAGAQLWTDIDAILVDTTEIGVAGAGLTEAGGTGDQFTALPEVTADVTKISGDAIAANNCESFFDGTGYAGTNNVIPSVTTVTGNVNGSVGSVTGAVGSVTAGVTLANGAHGGAATVITLQTPITANATQIEGGDATDAINAACDSALSDYDAPTATEMTSAFTEIKGATWSSGTDTLEDIRDATGALDAANTELASAPTTISSTRAMIQWLFSRFNRNYTATETTETIYKEDGSTALSSATLSDDGTTFTRGEHS